MSPTGPAVPMVTSWKMVICHHRAVGAPSGRSMQRVVFTIFGKNNFNLREAFFLCLAVIAFLVWATLLQAKVGEAISYRAGY